MTRTVFYISDGTGITAETLARSLLTQFDTPHFREIRIPFLDSVEKAQAARAQIEAAGQAGGGRALVFNTVVDADLCAILAEGKGLIIDLFGQFLPILESELQSKSAQTVGKAHGIGNIKSYDARISATNYALSHDDGLATDYADSDVILVGVSRSGKTPTCLYLALHYGVRAANFPLTEDELNGGSAPEVLLRYRRKLFGLSISPDRLRSIREKRRPGSRYASRRRCMQEVAEAEMLFKSRRIPFADTTDSSIEEIASRILMSLNLDKHLF